MKTCLFAFGLGGVLLVFSVSSTRAAMVTVCDEITLRSALASGGTVLFDCAGTIALSNTLAITADTVLDGNGHAIVLSGNNTVRVFYVNSAVQFTVRNLTIANGAVVGTNAVAPGDTGEDAFGAGIYNRGALTLVNCVLTNHTTHGGRGGPRSSTPTSTIAAGPGGPAAGAAIYNENGNVWCTNSAFLANSASGGMGGDDAGSAFDMGAGGSAFGGALFSKAGSYIFTDSTFANNTVLGGEADRGSSGAFGLAGSGFGGAICNLGAKGTIVQGRFTMNKAAGASIGHSGVESGAGMGGAIYTSNGVVSITGGAFISNVAESGRIARFAARGPARGGAIANSGVLEATDCLFSGNSAFAPGNGGHGTDASGGAIENTDRLSVMACTFVGNAARGGNSGNVALGSWPAGNAHGGAIHNLNILHVTNSTFAGNLARGGDRQGIFSGLPGGEGNGGAIANLMSMTVVHATAGSNSAVLGASMGVAAGQGSGGGAYSASNAVSILQNTILAGNMPGSNGFGLLLDQGNNLSADASCQFTAAGSLNNTDPALSPLDDFGGPTPSMALLAGSPAIDAGFVAHCAATDQRGVARPFGNGCDIGAFESAPPYTVRGTIHGYKPPQGITVTTGLTSATSDGKYILFSLNPGTHNIVPSSSEAICIPNSRLVDVSSDVLGIDFKAFRFNGLTVHGFSTQTLSVVYAGMSGQIREIQRSRALEGPWTPFSTNTVGADGLFTFQVPVASAEPYQYFRARHLAP